MIRVNDKYEVSWHQGMTVRDVLKACKFSFPLIIVSIEGTVVDRADYDSQVVQDDSSMKVLHLIAGG